MDFLISPHFRLPYILIFPILVNELLASLNTYSSLLNSDELYLKLTFKILVLPIFVVGFLGLKFFPLLACVEASHLFLGHCLGLLYSTLWFLDGLLQYIIHWVCIDKDNLSAINIAADVLGQLPVILITFSVVVWYVCHTVLDIVNAIRGRGLNPPPPEVKESYLLIVKTLLTRPPDVKVQHSRVSRFLLAIKQYIFPYSKYHKLPLPFLCVVSAIAMFLYQLTLPLAVVGFSLVDEFSKLYHIFRDHLNLTQNSNTNDLVKGILVGIPVAFAFSPIVSFVLCGFLLIHMIATISKIVKSVARYGFTESLPAKLSRVPSAWTYLGVQFGYFVCAYFIYTFVTFLLGVALVGIILGFKFFTKYLVNALLLVIIPVIFARVLFFLQNLLCKFIFFENSEGKFISITNRRLFNWLAYLLFFYNGIAGLVSAIIRVALSALVTLLLLFRLDTVVMAKGFEFLDFGHRAFLGFYYLYYSYNNAVMHTFIHLLKTSVTHSTHPEQYRHLQEDEAMAPLLQDTQGSPTRTRYVLEEVHSRQLHRNRWMVAYTLIRNPSLQPLTASNIAREKRAELTTPLSEGEEGLKFRGNRIIDTSDDSHVIT